MIANEAGGSFDVSVLICYSPEGSFGEGEAVFADPFDTEIPGGRFIEEEQDLFSLILKLALDCTEIPGGRLSFFVSPPDELFDCTEIPGGSLDRLAGAAGLSSLLDPANVAKNGNESCSLFRAFVVQAENAWIATDVNTEQVKPRFTTSSGKNSTT